MCKSTSAILLALLLVACGIAKNFKVVKGSKLNFIRFMRLFVPEAD
ncbi:MAG: hypothetical protein ACRES4_07565 [Nevskiales bacterium]